MDDAADAIVAATACHNDPQPINLGTGREITIADLANRIAQVCGFHGRIEWDRTRPDGQPRRRLDTTRAATLLDWRAKVGIDEGLQRTMDGWRRRERPERG